MATPEYLNGQGLYERFGRQDEFKPQIGRCIDSNGDEIVAGVFSYDHDPANRTNDDEVIIIPALAYIEDVYIRTLTAFDSTTPGTDTVSIGLAKKSDQTVIDADGLLTADVVNTFTANGIKKGDGALVGGAVTIGADDAVLTVTETGSDLTAGKYYIRIRYVPAQLGVEGDVIGI